jgi:SpoVK/Ycf46/Vps4 family AAA+-type ATPase
VTYQAPQAKPGEKKPLLNSSVKKNIDEKFLSVHTSQKERDKLQKYGLTPPNSILLYGPSNSANKTAAVYIASNLGKNLKELNFTDDKAFNAWLEKFHPDSDIVYINLKKIGIQSYKKITDILDKGKVMYILSAKESDAHATHLKVEVSLPDEAIRGEVLHRNLDKTPKDEQFNFALVTQATDGLKLKKIEKLLQEIKRKAFETSSPIITELALETITSSKKPKISSTAPASVNDFVGMEELHEKFDFYLQVLKNPEEAKEYGVKLPAGMLLYGPPGCGKTYTAKHLCDYAKSKGVHLNFQEIKASDVASKWKGEGIQKIHKVFEEAKRCAPVILFIDECEGLFPSREQAKDHNIIIVGATNHISSIDSAILRTGRFDYTFEVKPPNEATRRKMFEAKLKLKKCDPHLDLETVVKNSEGFSASDIETAVNDAGLSSWKQKTPINQAILMKSLETIKSKKASVTHEPGKEPGLPPIMHDLKKGVDALRQFVGNLDSIRPQAAVANDMH